MQRLNSGESYVDIGRSIGLNYNGIKRLSISYQIILNKEDSKIYKVVQEHPIEEFRYLVTIKRRSEICDMLGINSSMLDYVFVYYGLNVPLESRVRHANETKASATEQQKQQKTEKLRASTTKQWVNRSADDKKRIYEKALETKRKNKSFNTSKPEENLYHALVDKYGECNVYRQYYDDYRYPFMCDFYIKSCDLFIELNLFCVHGTHPFVTNSILDQIEMGKIIEKANYQPLMVKKLNTWLCTDFKKLETAINENLNYVAIYEDGVYSTIPRFDIGAYSELSWYDLRQYLTQQTDLTVLEK